jgi:hypothetical protein
MTRGALIHRSTENTFSVFHSGSMHPTRQLEGCQVQGIAINYSLFVHEYLVEGIVEGVGELLPEGSLFEFE